MSKGCAPISADTIRRALKEANLVAIQKKKEPALGASDRRRRLQWAFGSPVLNRRGFGLWSDETKVNFHNSEGI